MQSSFVRQRLQNVTGAAVNQARGDALGGLAERVGVSAVNLSVLRSGRAKAGHFSTLVAVCGALGCGVGDLLEIASGAAD